MSIAQPLSIIGAGLFIAVAGVLIKYFGYTNLIAGYDPEKVTDEEGLADFVGTRVLALAALTLAVGGVEYVATSDGTSWYWYAYVGLVVVIAVWMIRGAQRYQS